MSLRQARMLASRQFRDGRFHNPSGVVPFMPTDDVAWRRLGMASELIWRGRYRRPNRPLPRQDPRPTWAKPSQDLRVTWLGHSTVLLELGPLRVLTDPVWGNRASPLGFAGPKRFGPMPVALADMPALDAIVLSHNHYDHLCATTMRGLASTTCPIITSLGVGATLEQLGVAPSRIVELDWWETSAQGGLHITATPAQHFSGRGVSDRNRTLWSSMVIASEHHKVFFSGDTGLFPELADIATRLGPFDLTMLEIGAWHPAWGHVHLGPANALQAHALLGGGTLLPIHWATFDLALHPWDEPGETLLDLAAKQGTRIITPQPGQPVRPRQEACATAWWRA